VDADGTPSILATQSGTYTTVLPGGGEVRSELVVPDAVPLPSWDLAIEDWNEGEKVINTEEKYDHVTREAYWTTKKTRLEFPGTSLVPWKDLPATPEQLAQLGGTEPSMAQVSGTGTYRTSFSLPEAWSVDNGAYLQLGSTNGDLAEIVVNGERIPGFDTRTLRVDISDAVQAGENEVEITVATTLTNRLLARGYSTRGPAQDYGLTGDVRVVPYTVDAVNGLEAEVSTTIRALAGKAYVSVRTVNESDEPVDIHVETPFGSKTFADVQPGKTAAVSVNTRQTSIPAGEATVTVSGEGDSTVYTADFGAYPGS
jgi:hypothetical protein